MQKETFSQMNSSDTGLLLSPEFPKTNTSIYTKSPHLLTTLTTNSTNRYGGLPSPYEKEPIPVPLWSSVNSDCVPLNATVVTNNDVHPSHIYHPNKFSSEAEKLQERYPHVGMVMPPNNYFGHIKINRYDFTTEEPYARKEKAAKGPCPVHGEKGRYPGPVNHNEQEGNLEDVDMSRSDVKDDYYISADNGDHVNLESRNQHREQNQDIIPYASHDSLFDVRDVSNVTPTDEINSYLPNKFHWPGYSQHNKPYNDDSFDGQERMMNCHYTRPSLLPMTPKPTLPGIGSFTNPLQYMGDFGYRGLPNPFLPPIFYPGNFESSLLPPPSFLNLQSKFFPFANSQYYWMHERSRDLAASIYPTVIRPKPMDDTSLFARLTGAEPEAQSSIPYHSPYPSPAVMFRAANLIPPFFLSRRDNTTSSYTYEGADGGTRNEGNAPGIACAPTSVIKTLSSLNGGHYQNNTSFYSHQSTVPWMKADNAVSYTVAAAPSEVMTYLPNTSPDNCDGVESPESDDDEDKMYMGDYDGAFYSYQESFNEMNVSKEIKKSIPPSRKSHVCDICGKTYARAFTLKTHQRVHTGEKPYKCKVCLRTFAQGSGLESHMRIHTGEKPYKCPLCHRAFSHSSAVKSHLRTHTGEKPFRCDLCGKYFGDQSTLKKHTRVHTGEKPFKCYVCNLTFTQVGNMNKHLKNVHGDKSA